MQNPYQYYMENVFPQVPDAVRADTLGRYPDVTLTDDANTGPLGERQVVMFVGLTGTGKSTTLAALHERAALQYTTAIPSRREITDLILIPCAQAVRGEPAAPVKDRERRFGYTRTFREQVAPGGAAAAFTWLRTSGEIDTLILSEGVRGPNEIEYALAHTRWCVIELWVDPLTRLQRLSSRGGAFDRVANADATDLSFLPEAARGRALALLAAGEITPAAVTTARAEASNYGGTPYDADNTMPRYRCLHIDDMTPAQVAVAAEDAVQTLTGS